MTLYKITEKGGREVYTHSAKLAESYSERGFRVTALEKADSHPAQYCREASQGRKRPKDGESYDKTGGIRPVPPGVSNTPRGE